MTSTLRVLSYVLSSIPSALGASCSVVSTSPRCHSHVHCESEWVRVLSNHLVCVARAYNYVLIMASRPCFGQVVHIIFHSDEIPSANERHDPRTLRAR
ncbi:hypothetical protein C8Q74DRAFT_516955 [Fomes fomentarius]|nr:hypothetical protein C8Q74DRAFT_516955 [Fomes fomentarius]